MAQSPTIAGELAEHPAAAALAREVPRGSPPLRRRRREGLRVVSLPSRRGDGVRGLLRDARSRARRFHGARRRARREERRRSSGLSLGAAAGVFQFAAALAEGLKQALPDLGLRGVSPRSPGRSRERHRASTSRLLRRSIPSCSSCRGLQPGDSARRHFDHPRAHLAARRKSGAWRARGGRSAARPHRDPRRTRRRATPRWSRRSADPSRRSRSPCGSPGAASRRGSRPEACRARDRSARRART